MVIKKLPPPSHTPLSPESVHVSGHQDVKPSINETSDTDIDLWKKRHIYKVLLYRKGHEAVEKAHLYVFWQPLRQLLKDVIGNYPGYSIDMRDLRFMEPYYPLFHYRQRLEEVGLDRFNHDGDHIGDVVTAKNRESDAKSRDELQHLLQFIDEHFERDIKARYTCLASETKAISYEHAWTLFKPGAFFYDPSLSRAFRVASLDYDNIDKSKPSSIRFHGRFIDYLGGKDWVEGRSMHRV